MYPFAEIGGIRLPWAYRGARELCDWVLERPWATGEPVRRLLTAGGAAADLIARWVEELAWRAEKEGGGASVSVVDGAAARPGLDEVLSAELGIARAGDRSAWLSSVADGLAVRPILFLVRFDEVPGPGEAWTEAATDLLADLRKVLGGPTAAVLVLERETGSSRDLDFRCGLPLPDPTWMEDSVQEAWRCYVHMRVAWEAAGDLSLALRWNDLLGDRAVDRDDQKLETWFVERARAEWDGVPEAKRLAVRSQDDLPAPRGATDCACVPLGTASPRWRPWYVRAALTSDASPEMRRTARSALHCLPIARDVFSRCLDLEARVRPALKPSGSLAPKTVADAEAFRTSSPKSPRCFYPGEGAPLPEDDWDFASFGELLNGDPSCRPREALYSFLGLRNAVAHGHFPGWEMVRRYRSLRQELVR